MVLFVAASCGIVLLLRPFVRRNAVEGAQWDRVLGYIVGTFGVFFGILLGLVAVSVYNDYTDAHSAALEETSRLSSLYRSAAGLPEPLSTELQDELKSYTRTVIDGDWPQQEQDQLPTASLPAVDRIQRTIDSFDPHTLKEQAQYAQILSTFDSFVEARRARTDATTVELPGLFWLVIWAGAIINAVLIGFIEVKNVRQHLLMAGLLALFISLVMFVTADMDHPYAGSISVDPGDFVRLLQQWERSG
ncbi:hypothetical protein ASF88_09410 [Leifsonia sp. Leaf336]|uniref:bestrophin-like domain n=1 Tax=Leifsonia sp. Leaf336 TaxID=1736341 RepID=UPI0006F30097|nr:DUF4239 domain-containing protein [Leifsonia sp. Leaf336]KQR51821.1 hypothetical protein ASF88_09410 [Leifsonia sp. Leaf336]